MAHNPSRDFTRTGIAGSGILLIVGMSLMVTGVARAATTIDGPIDLGGATTFGVLGASAVTNTGPSVISGDIGVSPGTSITGFTGAPDGSFTGTLHQTDAFASQGQSDLTTAFNTAGGLTPTTSGLGDLSGLSLTPGVYSGGALSLSGNLTLAGSASSIWVFQAASTLTTASASTITLTGGTTSCNVFWQVGSSATLGTSSIFVGTILAHQSITASTGANVAGRLLASNGAVTLDDNTVTVPTGCDPPGTPIVTGSPAITSGAPTSATEGTPYSFTITASGTPVPAFAVTAGSLPAGLSLNGTTGAILGTPTAAGSSTFTIAADNGVPPQVSAVYTLTTAATSTTPTLAETGSDSSAVAVIGGGLILFGVLLRVATRARRTPRNAHGR